jgi:hypothetical protein
MSSVGTSKRNTRPVPQQQPNSYPPSAESYRNCEAALRQFLDASTAKDTYPYAEAARILDMEMTAEHWQQVVSGECPEWSLRTNVMDGRISPISGVGETTKFSRAGIASFLPELDTVRLDQILTALAEDPAVSEVRLPKALLKYLLAKRRQ